MNLNRLTPGLVATLLLLSAPAWAVDCAPESITLSSQAEVDNFQTNHGPGCDTVVASLTIEGVSITDLSPVSGLTAVSTVGPFGFGTRLVINNTSVTTLTGLENLSDVFWIELNNNGSLTSLVALSNLVSVRGPFFVNGNAALTSLNGLENLTTLPGGALFIENNTLLSDLSGVSNITSINASLVISNNDALVNLDDFAGLSQVSSNISILNNDLLDNTAGLGGLTGFIAAINVRDNSQLSTLGDLSNINRLDGLVIWNNPLLSHLDGLINLTHMGDGSPLALRNNNSLNNIEGLSSLISAEFDVEISDNPMLADCSALKTLLDLVDDGEPGPGPGGAGIPDVGGDVTVANNLPGCNSLAEILAPAVGTIAYGGIGRDRPHLLFKGLNVTLNCFHPLQAIAYNADVPDNRLQFSCSGIPYADADTLIYDVAENRCQRFTDFQAGTKLQTDGVYLENDNNGDALQQQTEAILDADPNALLLFDPQVGELVRGQSLVCATPGPSLIIFRSGFE